MIVPASFRVYVTCSTRKNIMLAHVKSYSRYRDVNICSKFLPSLSYCLRLSFSTLTQFFQARPIQLTPLRVDLTAHQLVFISTSGWPLFVVRLAMFLIKDHVTCDVRWRFGGFVSNCTPRTPQGRFAIDRKLGIWLATRV